MQAARILALSAVAVPAAADPLAKVYQMLDNLKADIIKEGEAEAKTYKKFFDWCDNEASEKRNEISSAEAKKADLEGTIKSKASEAEASSAAIEELAANVARDSAELKETLEVRDKEAADFATNEADIVATIDTLGRAIGVIEKQGGSAAFAQVDTANVDKTVATLRTIVDAASFGVADKQRLAALIQAKQSSDADDEATSAPAAAGYQSHSGGILDVLESLKEEAEEQLSNLRKAETTAAHNSAKLKQSLEDSIAADTAGSNESKSAMAAAQEAKAAAEGELARTVTILKDGNGALAAAHSDCIRTAADHEKTVLARTEEVNVIAQAEKILKESTGGAVEQTYSLLQVSAGAGVQSTLRTRADLAHSEIVAIVKRLARQHHSSVLAQLASRLSAVVRFSAKSGADPFAKIRAMIESIISKLQSEGAAEATEEAYCTEQMAKTGAKKAELEEDVEKLTTKVDQATSKSVSLKEEANTVQAELAELVKQQTEMDTIRSEEHENYVEAKDAMESGLRGVRQALQVLRDYYGNSASASLIQDSAAAGSAEQQPAKPQLHDKSQGAGGSIISILEVCESDFASGLSKVEMEEADAASEYGELTQDNKVTKLAKEQDVKYKLQAATQLAKALSDMKSDLETDNKELVSVLKYFDSIKARCTAQPSSYEEQKAKRDAEIRGLKEALSVLENETALLQRKSHVRRNRFLRK